jgi:hypothetical protein
MSLSYSIETLNIISSQRIIQIVEGTVAEDLATLGSLV